MTIGLPTRAISAGILEVMPEFVIHPEQLDPTGWEMAQRLMLKPVVRTLLGVIAFALDKQDKECRWPRPDPDLAYRLRGTDLLVYAVQYMVAIGMIAMSQNEWVFGGETHDGVVYLVGRPTPATTVDGTSPAGTSQPAGAPELPTTRDTPAGEHEGRGANQS
jgi:hypothetical protein